MDDLTADLTAELEEKDAQLRKAAELGQSLLLRTESLQKMNTELEQERDSATAAIEEHEYRIAELAADASKLQAILRAKETTLAEMQRTAAAMDGARGGGVGGGDAGTGPSMAKPEAEDGSDGDVDGARARLEGEISRLKVDAAATREEEGALLAAAELERSGRRKAEQRHASLLAQLDALTQDNERQAAATQAARDAQQAAEAAASVQREQQLQLEARLAALQAQLDLPAPPPPRLSAAAAAAAAGVVPLVPLPLVSAPPSPGPRSPSLVAAVTDAGAIEQLLRDQAGAARIRLEPAADLRPLAEALAAAGGGTAHCKNLLTTARLAAMRARRREVTAVDLEAAATKLDLLSPPPARHLDHYLAAAEHASPTLGSSLRASLSRGSSGFPTDELSPPPREGGGGGGGAAAAVC